MPERNNGRRDLPENVKIAILVARSQGMTYAAIAESLSEYLGKRVPESRLRMFCARHGMVVPRILGWTPPEGYEKEYKRLKDILGVRRAREEVVRVAERDKRRNLKVAA